MERQSEVSPAAGGAGDERCSGACKRGSSRRVRDVKHAEVSR
jgi:hypothetical protein